MRWSGMYLIDIPKGENSDNGEEVVFKKTMAENFLYLKKVFRLK